MTALNITYIIGTDNVGIGEEEIDSIDGYREDLEECLVERFPEANVYVGFERGSSKVRVEVIDWETMGEHQEAIIETVNNIADGVWNHGNWHNAPGHA